MKQIVKNDRAPPPNEEVERKLVQPVEKEKKLSKVKKQSKKSKKEDSSSESKEYSGKERFLAYE